MDTPMSEPGPNWADTVTATVAAQVRSYRTEKGLSLQGLAQRCTNLGYPTIRTTLANLEAHKRKSVTIHEILVLAMALEVPPVVLLFPNLANGQVEILPGVTATSWDALKWFSGEEFLQVQELDESTGEICPAPFGDDHERVGSLAMVRLEMLREHEKLAEVYLASIWRANDAWRAAGDTETDEVRRLTEAEERHERALEDHRRKMTQAGLTLPYVMHPTIGRTRLDENAVGGSDG